MENTLYLIMHSAIHYITKTRVSFITNYQGSDIFHIFRLFFWIIVHGDSVFVRRKEVE